MDSMDWRYFSWSSLFFPIRGVEIQELVPRCLKDHNWCRSLERTSLDVEDSPGTTCISVWAVQCAESQQGRRPGRRNRQKSNLVFTSPQKKNKKKKTGATCNHDIWYDVKEEPFQFHSFFVLNFAFLDLCRQNYRMTLSLDSAIM